MDPRLTSLAVAAFLAALGLVVLLARPGAWLHRVLCALLLLRGASTSTFALLRYAPDAGAAEAFARLTVWYATPHAFLLLALGVVLLRPPRPTAAAILAGGGALTLALLAAHALVPGALVADVQGIPAAGTYGYVSAMPQEAASSATLALEAALALAFARAGARREASERRAWALLALAFCVVPIHTASVLGGLALANPARLLDAGFALRWAGAAAALLLVGLAARALLAAAPLVRAGLWILPLGALLGLLGGLAATRPTLAALFPFYDVGVPLARAAFGAALALALLRHGLAGLGEAGRARLARLARAALALAGVAFAAALALAVLGRPTPALQAAPAAALGALLLSPVPPRQLWSRRADADALPRVGRYRLERELGRGATATAWLAHDPRSGRRVVVKRHHGDAAGPALREAAVLRGLRHPRVMPLLDAGRDAEGAWLVLPHYEGGTLRALLDREGPLAPARGVALARDVADALSALHARRVVHRDVKAENVFLDAEGRAVLGDLGSARAADRDATLTGPASGVSLSGVAPEVLRGRPASPASDVYAAGALLHRLLTGRHYVALEEADAFEARERILLDAPRLPDPRVPPAVDALLRACLAKDPAERPPDGEALARALSRLEREQRASDADEVAGREGARLPAGERREVDSDGVARAG